MLNFINVIVHNTRILIGGVIGYILYGFGIQNDVSTVASGCDGLIRIYEPPFNTTNTPEYMFYNYPNIHGDKLDEIVNGLYLTSYKVMLKNIDDIKHQNIKYVVSLGNDFYQAPYLNNSENYTFDQILNVCIADSPSVDLYQYLDICTEYINNIITSEQRVVVHCYAGVSRSASIVIAWLIKYKHMSYEQAYRFVVSKRKFIEPNIGFIRQLKNYAIHNATKNM